MSKYYAKGLPWNSGIGKYVADCTTSQEVLTKANMDFSVAKCPLIAKMPIFGNNEISEDSDDFAYNGHMYRDCPNAYGTYRTDMNVPLGIVKSKYEVVQNREAFRFFDEVIGDQVKWDRAGVFGYGHKIFISAKLEIQSDVNGDPVDNYLVFSNSHDGSSSINILFCPIRVFCTNMLSSAFNASDGYIRLRHTNSVKDKLAIGQSVLKAAFEYAKSTEQLYKALNAVQLGDDAVMKYLAELQLTQEEQEAIMRIDSKHGFQRLMYRDSYILDEAKISTRKSNTIINMWDYYNNGVAQEKIIGTAWGAYNAVTGYYSNAANLEGEKRVDSLLYGTANNNIVKALSYFQNAV